MNGRGLLVAAVLAGAAFLSSGCATDPFDWKDDRPQPRFMVRQHLLRGTGRVLEGPYPQIYRAAARAFDRSSYYSLTRDRGALYADDFHGMSSVGVFLHTTQSDDRTFVEVLYAQENAASFRPERPSRRWTPSATSRSAAARRTGP